MENWKLKVLAVDDEAGFLRILKRDLEALDCDVVLANDGQEGLRLLSEHAFDLAFVDLRMPGFDGIEAMQKMKAQVPDLPIVMVTGHGSIDTAVAAIKAGATEFMTKPVDDDHLKVVMARIRRRLVQNQRLRLLEEQVVEGATFKNMVGISKAMQDVYTLIRQVSDSDATVLVQGETGTGKELVARAIHDHSPRRDKPFVAVNCGALTDTLLENELFGHEKGAFTGAVDQKIGLVEQASGGTLFLDEVEAMSTQLQTRFLRVIQDKEIRRVGGGASLKVDFRLLAATNQDLNALVETGTFRSDLYFRLHVVMISVPPLRMRYTDIPVLVQHFAAKWSQVHERAVPEFTPEAMMALNSYPWPGNVRELENVVTRILLLCQKAQIGLEDLPPEMVGNTSDGLDAPVWDLPLRDAVQAFECDYLLRKLKEANGRVVDAARLAGVRRERFSEKMRRHKINRQQL